MAELLLPSLEIENFRAFKHLTIEKLGRVNLIVGKNSVGKSCLLEAIWLFTNKPTPYSIQNLLSFRGEHVPREKHLDAQISETISALRYIFHGRKLEVGSTTASIGQKHPGQRYEFGAIYYTRESNTSDTPQPPKILKTPNPSFIERLHLGLSVSQNDQEPRIHSLDTFTTTGFLNPEKDTPPCNYVPTALLNEESVASFWNNITLTKLEDEVLGVISPIIPEIQRITLVTFDEKYSPYRSFIRVFMAKLKGQDDPIPLSSLGDGVVRALDVGLALVNSRNGILLIDEFENGLYHGVQTNLWRLIFRIAHELNIQVFATTHNWDCIKAFQKAAQEDQNEEAMLIRLERKGDDIRAVSIDEETLEIVTSEHIEIR